MSRGASPSGAPTVIRGAKLWTPGWSSSRAAEVLIEGGRIVGVTRPGRNDVPDAVDLEGGLLMPAFQDAHVHPHSGGSARLACDLSGASSVDDTLDRVARYARQNRDSAWIEGGGWPRELLMFPTRGMLDAVTGNRPAVLRSSDCHSVWLNSAALAAARISKATPDPVHGRILRDVDGEPSGLLDESAINLLDDVVPAKSPHERKRALLRGVEELLSFGVVSWQDAIVGTGLGMSDVLDDYVELIQSGRLTGRLTAALWWDPLRGTEQIADLAERRSRLESAGSADHVVADTVKVMLDAAGMLFLDAGQTRELTVALDQAGLSIHFHACGSLAVHHALDALEAARKANGNTSGRHHIAHLFDIAAADLPRFQQLGVTANLQGAWSSDAPPVEYFPRVGHDHHSAERLYPFGQLERAGAQLCAGSDWPVSTADPLAAAAAVTARTDYAAPARMDDLENLDLASFFTAYTAGSAYVNGRSDRTGRLAEGYLADLVHLSGDPFDGVSVAEVLVDGVWVGGNRRQQSDSTP